MAVANELDAQDASTGIYTTVIVPVVSGANYLSVMLGVLCGAIGLAGFSGYCLAKRHASDH